ncbi:MAG: hypothetical protein GXP63_02770 [DPANN group archaeon]|nr:hypothetical protein [DPANN group archaeon]
MGELFPYLDAKEVYDLLLLDNQEWLVLRNTPDPTALNRLRKRYRHVITLEQLMDSGELVRLFCDSTSVLRKRDYGKALGLVPTMALTYALDGLDHVQKTRFGYALRGRNSQEGALQKLGARMVGRNALMVPVRNISEMNSFFDAWKVKTRMFLTYLPEERNQRKEEERNERG